MCIKINVVETANRLDFKDLYSPIVCGNSNYKIEFDFGKDWQLCKNKIAIFVVDGKKSVVKFEGSTLSVPALPNAPFVMLSLQGYIDDETILNSTGLKINLQTSPGLNDLSELEPLDNFFIKIVSAIDKIEKGDLSVKFAEHAETAEHSNTCERASFADDATHAESADTATSATNAENANNAVHAESAVSAKNAESATHAESADTANNATNAVHADTAEVANDAIHATNAESAENAVHAGSADTAENASHADSADTATSALSATNAENAESATHAESAENAVHAESADTAENATHADSADTAENANNATHAESADTAKVADSSKTQVDLSSDQDVGGVKNFTGDINVGGKSVKNLIESSEDFVDKSTNQTIVGDKTFLGKVVLGDTDLNSFVENAIDETDISNPNIIINSNFKINQRAESSYSGDTYTVDRWLGYEGLTVEPVADGVTLKSVGKNSSTSENLFMQKFEWSFEKFGGKTLTLSAKVGGVVYAKAGTVDPAFVEAKEFISINIGANGGASDCFLKFKVDQNKMFSVAFDLSDSSTTKVEYVKLEFGDIATAYIAPDSNDEINKCERYYFHSNATYIFDFAQNYYYLMNHHVRMRNKMRAVPKVTVFSYPMTEDGEITGDRIDGYFYNITRETTSKNSIEVHFVSQDCVILRESGGGLISGSLYSAGVILDAEI